MLKSSFVFLLTKGEQDRQWLLQDMAFPDQYESRFMTDRLEQFKEKAMDYIRKSHLIRQKKNGQSVFYQQVEADDGDDEDSDNSFWNDDEEVPQWIRDKYPDLIHGPKRSR